MNPKISIILPVYQVEEYIGETIKSIINQTFKDFELVIVNDGTKDNSINIANKLLANTKINYSIYNQKNRGLSAARNKGIEKATGEWIVCIDSDDVISNYFLEILYNPCEEGNFNLSICSFQGINNLEEIDHISKKVSDYKYVYSQNDILNYFLTRNIKIIVPGLLLKKDFLLANSISFDESVSFSEDQLFIWDVLFNIDRCVYNDVELYFYLKREGSIMTSSDIKKIMTGYNAFKYKFPPDKIDKSNEVSKFIFPRWILGALRAASRILSYKEFKKLSKKMDYKNNTKPLHNFPDIKTRLFFRILNLNLPIFYIISRL